MLRIFLLCIGFLGSVRPVSDAFFLSKEHLLSQSAMMEEALCVDSYKKMNLEGLEKGVNDSARERAIVVHGADYANPSVIASGGRLGRSLGCPALPRQLSRPIIDAIKDGSVLYIYAPQHDYLAQSAFLN